ncbi:hypothetical protein T484DRAFT_1611711 [Baffinella frigidus]|nr:hypothetical protein T484DRAFT_1611711 [Cryptophyta sp. CCMP2293]
MVPRTAAARAALLIVAAAACAAVAAGEDLAGTPPGGESAEAAGDKSRVGGRGFGENVDWFSFAAGIREAEATQRPAMVVIHKSWCGACKSLGPKFAASEDIMARASNFVMINVHDDEEPNDEGWRPDGGYIPRILMYDGKHGEV